MKKIIYVVSSIAAIFMLQSCSDKDVAKPVAVLNSAQSSNAEVALKGPVAADYTVSLYIENGDTSTTEFKNYTFTFKQNNVLFAKVDSLTYAGKWESNNNGKQLKLDIKGNAVLEDVNKGWDIVKLSATQISLKNNQGKFGNQLIFKIK